MKKVRRSGVVSLLVLGSVSGAVWAQAPAEQTKTGGRFNSFFTDKMFDEMLADLQGTQEEHDKAVAAAPNDPKVYEKRGYFYFKKKNYDKALADYQKALQLNPKSVNVHEELALLYRAQKDTKNALAEYEKAIALEAPKTDVLRKRGDYFAELGLNDKALADYNQAIAQQPTDFRTYLWRALFFKGQEQYNKVLLDYNKIVELRPKDDDYIFEQAETLRALKRYDEAIAGYQKALDVNPQRVFVLNEIANTYWEAGAPEKSLEFFNKGIATNDEKTRRYSYLNRGLVFYVQKKRASALEDLSKAIEMETALRTAKGKEPLKDKVFAQAYFYRSLINGRKLSLISKAADSVPVSDDAAHAVQLDSQLAAQYTQDATTLLDIRDAKYAIAALLTGGAAAKPNDVSLLLALAKAQKDALNSKGALETYTKALTIEPKSLAALSGRATACANGARPYNADEWLPAVADWKSYVALKHDDSKAWQQLGIAQYNVGQTADGIATFRQILAGEKENAYAHVMLGLGLAINGDKDVALAEAKNYIKKLTPDETQKAKSNVGNATTHYPQNAVVKALYELIPGAADDDDDNAPIFFV